jgi:small subunit ribosomal protein S20
MADAATRPAFFFSRRRFGSGRSLSAAGFGVAIEQAGIMANTKSAKKATRKIAARTEVNKSRRSRMRTFIRGVEEAIASGDQTKALTALQQAEPEIMRAAQKGVLPANTASRKVSRLTQRVKKLSA